MSTEAGELHRIISASVRDMLDAHRIQSSAGPVTDQALESKGSTRPWEIQSHYNHEGWYIVWRYMLDPTKKIKKGKPIVVWRVDIPYLKKGNWIHQGSKAAEGTGGRTHTFGVRKASTVIRPCVVYHAPNVQLYRSKPNLADTAEE